MNAVSRVGRAWPCLVTHNVCDPAWREEGGLVSPARNHKVAPDLFAPLALS